MKRTTTERESIWIGLEMSLASRNWCHAVWEMNFVMIQRSQISGAVLIKGEVHV
jgi:hypothetical protein